MRIKAGYTLVELMVAVIIIGILVTIAIPNYARSIERSKCSQALQILKDMRTAGLSYYANNETFPGPGSESDLEDEVGANFYSDGSNDDWTFSITTGNTTTFVVQAQRRRGPHSGSIINIADDPTQSEFWGGDYPRLDPGNW